MRFFGLFLGVAMLAACNDDGTNQAGGPAGGSAQGGSAQGGSEQGGSEQGGSEQGGSEQGGSGEGGAPSGDTLSLDIAPDENASVTCATYIEGAWGVAETGFVDGEVENLDCALVAVFTDGLPTPFWITSRSFEGIVGADADLRHAFATAEAEIALGSTPLDLQDGDFVSVFTGAIEVISLDADSVEIRVE